MEELAAVAAVAVIMATIFGIVFIVYFVKLTRRLTSLAQVLKHEAELRISASYELPPPMPLQQASFTEVAGEKRNNIARSSDQGNPQDGAKKSSATSSSKGFNLAREVWEKVYWSAVAALFLLRLFGLGPSNLADPAQFGHLVGQTLIGGLALWALIKLVAKAARV